MSFDLVQFQMDHSVWVMHNFPHQCEPRNRHQSFLGVVEEVGELAHTMLKYEQGIREGAAARALRDDLADGVGDLIIYLAGVCDTYGLSLEACIESTWDKVKQRDWVADPQSGGEVRPSLDRCPRCEHTQANVNNPEWQAAMNRSKACFNCGWNCLHPDES